MNSDAETKSTPARTLHYQVLCSNLRPPGSGGDATPSTRDKSVSRLAFALLASLLALPTATAAQSPPAPQPAFEIRGKIVDTANTPLPRASVSLRLKSSKVTVAGAFAGSDGSFRITGLRPGNFSIRVVYIGYAPVIQDITLTRDTPILDLGVAKL